MRRQGHPRVPNKVPLMTSNQQLLVHSLVWHPRVEHVGTDAKETQEMSINRDRESVKFMKCSEVGVKEQKRVPGPPQQENTVCVS